MDQRGRSSRYGGGGGSGQQQQQFPFVVDPTEAAGAAVRAFFPAPDARGGEPPPSSTGDRAAGRYGGGHGEISLGHGHGHGMKNHHRYHQFGVEGKQQQQDGGGPSAAALPRHSSSPPGFFSSPVVDNGFLSARAGAGVGGEVHHAMASSYHKKMKSPMNLAGQGTLSHISDDGIPDLTNNVHGIGHSEENITANSVARSFSSGFSIGPWEDSNSIVFSSSASKSGMHNNDDIIASLSNYELQFGATKETAGMDKYLQMQQDQVPFRVRAKRGCATHPRSIAERERRTRISEKLRKLQALVPNMDKQTSTADMLDLAVDHIRGLQSELQALKKDKEKCTCSGNHPSGR